MFKVSAVAITLAIASALAPALAETIHGVVVYSRHGDRNSKHYPGYGLTNLGFQQNYQVGSDYRSLYLASNSSKQILGISENQYQTGQTYATAPDQRILLNTVTAFLQGLYPPVEIIDSSLAIQTVNDGTSYTRPLNGYQYAVVHGVSSNSPDRMWLKGDDDCPARDTAAGKVKESDEHRDKLDSTGAFYESFWPILQEVYDYRPENLTYDNAFDIFDLINVARIYNSSLAMNVTEEQLYQLRTLADGAEFDRNYSPTEPILAVAGQTSAGAILAQLDGIVSSGGKLKFSLMASSYDTFLSFFGLVNLTSASADFFGLPVYASTMVFELFTEEDVMTFPTDTNSLNVRFLFRNGSDADASLTAFPLFGRAESFMSWPEFVAEMERRAITSTEQWCSICASDVTFCAAFERGVDATESSEGRLPKSAIAAIAVLCVAVVVASALAAFFFFTMRRKLSKQRHEMGHHAVGSHPVEKHGSVSTDAS